MQQYLRRGWRSAVAQARTKMLRSVRWPHLLVFGNSWSESTYAVPTMHAAHLRIFPDGVADRPHRGPSLSQGPPHESGARAVARPDTTEMQKCLNACARPPAVAGPPILPNQIVSGW